MNLTTLSHARPLMLMAAVMCGLGASARADVNSYSVRRTISYSQTSNNAPVSPDFWNLIAFVTCTVPGEMLSATISRSTPGIDIHSMSSALPTFRQYNSPLYSNYASFIAGFPATTYTITVNRGGGPETGSVFLPADRYCTDIPALSGDTFDRVQSYLPSTDFHGTVNGFALAPGTNLGWTYIAVVPDGGPGVIWYAVLAPGETAFQIPAGTLTPSTGYSMGITYLNSTLLEHAGFAMAATSGAEYHRDTSVLFTTRAVGCDLAVTTHPASQEHIVGQSAMLGAAATGLGTLNYQWRKDGIALVDGPTFVGSTLAGATGPGLTITNMHLSDQGEYVCSITDDCGAVITNAATMIIRSHCRADFNDDGAANVQDIFDFLAAWFAGC